MEKVKVHPHALIHGLSEQDVIDAWESGGPRMPRRTPSEEEVVGIGWTRDGRAVQFVAVVIPVGALIIHALTPPTRSVMRELGVVTRERW